MGVQVTYCARCGLRLSAQQVASGEAVARNGALFCRGCAPALPGLDRPTLDPREYAQAVAAQRNAPTLGGDGRPAGPPLRGVPAPTPLAPPTAPRPAFPGAWTPPGPGAPAGGFAPRAPAFPPPLPPPLAASPPPPSPSRAPGAAIPLESEDGSSKLLEEGRRKRAERRLQSASYEGDDEEADEEPFPWLLVVAGAAAALLIVLALSFIIGRGDKQSSSPPADASQVAHAPPPPPPSGPTARQIADEILAKAHALESASDFDAACLALELPPGSPIRDDEAIDREVTRERERLQRKRQLQRARDALRRNDPAAAMDALRALVDGPDADEARRLRAEAERLLGSGPAASSAGGGGQHDAAAEQRASFLQAALTATGSSTEDELQQKRQAADEADARLTAELSGARIAHACWEDAQGSFTGTSMLGGVLNRLKRRKDTSSRGHCFLVFDEPDQSRMTFETAADAKPPRRVVIRIFASARAPEALASLTTQLLKITVNEQPAAEMLLTSSDYEKPRLADVTAAWNKKGSNRVVVLLGDGPSPVWLETVEVLVLD